MGDEKDALPSLLSFTYRTLLHEASLVTSLCFEMNRCRGSWEPRILGTQDPLLGFIANWRGADQEGHAVIFVSARKGQMGSKLPFPMNLSALNTWS